jgi:hypothetical protein
VQGIRREMESRMGKKAIPAKKDLLALLARAKDLPPNSF